MKKGCIVLGILISMLLFACSPEKGQDNIRIDTKPHQLNIDKNSISLGASSNLTADAKVTAENTGWEFSNIPSSWLEVKPSSGKTTTTVNITAQANTSVDETRIQVMQFHSTETDYNYSRDISVSQAAATVSIVPKETSFGCEAAANSKTIGIDANVEWDAECAESWLTLTKSKAQLTINVMENLGTSRTTTILLKRAGTTATVNTITVTQSEANVTGSTETLSFNVNGESREAPITAGASWTAYTSDESWLSVTPAEGKAGAATLIISTTANASSTTRNGFVYVKIGENTKLSIPVKQDCMSIKVEGTPTTLDGQGNSSFQLNVVSTSKWTISDKSEWLIITPANGEAGTTTIMVSVGKNPSIYYRSGSFTVGIPNTSLIVKVDVGQAGINIEEETLNFGWSKGMQTLEIPFPQSWNAMTSEDWITLSQYSGTGACEITVATLTNDNEYERFGTISFVTEGNTKRLNVHQEGQYLRIGETSGTVPAMGGTVSIAVNTTVGASERIEYGGNDKDWIQVNEDNNVYKLVVDINPSKYNRSAVFTIKPTMATTNQASATGVKYKLTQNGRTLSVNVRRIEFFSKGGSSSVYSIQADGEYNIQKSDNDSWYVLQYDETVNTFSLIASENTSKKKREGTLTLSLQNMPNGETYTIEIPVIQFPAGFSVGVEGFGEDQDWNE